MINRFRAMITRAPKPVSRLPTPITVDPVACFESRQSSYYLNLLLSQFSADVLPASKTHQPETYYHVTVKRHDQVDHIVPIHLTNTLIISFGTTAKPVPKSRQKGDSHLHYMVLSKELGNGGQATAIKSEHTVILDKKRKQTTLKRKDKDKRRAFKQFHKSTAMITLNYGETKTEPEHEYHMLAQLSSADIFPFHPKQPVFHKNTAFLAMRYFNGITLEALLRKQNSMPLTRGQRLQICIKLAEKLAKCHENRVGHFDLKPANVIVTFDKNNHFLDIHLIDFGYSRQLDSNRKGEIIGLTPLFAPPEAFQSYVIRNESSDVFSLGRTFWCIYFNYDPENLVKGDSNEVAIDKLSKAPIPSEKSFCKILYSENQSNVDHQFYELLKCMNCVNQKYRISLSDCRNTLNGIASSIYSVTQVKSNLDDVSAMHDSIDLSGDTIPVVEPLPANKKVHASQSRKKGNALYQIADAAYSALCIGVILLPVTLGLSLIPLFFSMCLLGGMAAGAIYANYRASQPAKPTVAAADSQKQKGKGVPHLVMHSAKPTTSVAPSQEQHGSREAIASRKMKPAEGNVGMGCNYATLFQSKADIEIPRTAPMATPVC